MRDRKIIEEEAAGYGNKHMFLLEVLLDIRDLLAGKDPEEIKKSDVPPVPEKKKLVATTDKPKKRKRGRPKKKKD